MGQDTSLPRAAWLLLGALACAALTQLPMDAKAQGAQGGTLDDILVTARRREESLQDTPISITAFEGQDLARRQIDALDGIAQFTPNLIIDTATTFSGANSTASVFIRGIGQVDFTATTEPGVGIYLDGVYISQTIGSILDLVDVERVEVLRGPQGTLFGRNTIGGAISVTSVKPDTESVYGDVKVTTGEDSRFDVSGFLNLPITDTLAARVSAAHFERDGYIEAPNSPGGDDLGDIDQDVARAAVRWTPTERFTADFTYDWSRSRESGAPVVNSTVYDGASLAFIGNLADPLSPDYVPPPNPLPAPSFVDLNNILATTPICTEGGIAPACGAPNPLFGGPTITSADTQPRDSGAQNLTPLDMKSDTDVWGVSLTLEYDFDWAVIKSITSYRDVDAFTVLDNDALLVVNNQLIDKFDIDQTTQEIQLTGTLFSDRLNWLVGGYFFKEDGLNLDQVQFTPVHILSGAEIDNESNAGFAQLTFDFNDKLSLTAGIRYTDETKKFKVGDECRKLPGGPVTRIADGVVVECTPLQTVIDPKFLNSGFLEFVGFPVFPDDAPDPNARVCCLPISDAEGNVVGLVRGLNPGEEVLPRGTSDKSFDEWTPMVSVSYNWNDDLLTYASYSKGFKSGGWVQRVFPPKTGVPSFEPETAEVYEIGAKWSGFDQRLRINGAAFHTDYDDLQIEVNDGIAPVTRNAAKAEINGFELELTAVPLENLLVQAGVGYLDAKYTKLDPSQDFFTDLVAFDKDSKLVNAPDWSVNIGGEYTFNLANGSSIITRVDYSWVDDTYKGALNFPELEQEAYDLWDAYITWVSPGDVWEASVFGQNLGDEDYIVSGFANALTQGKSQVSIGRPRQIGASLQYRFGGK